MTFATMGDLYNAYDGPIPQHVKEDNYHLFPEYHPDNRRKWVLKYARQRCFENFRARRSWKTADRYPEETRAIMFNRMTEACIQSIEDYRNLKGNN